MKHILKELLRRLRQPQHWPEDFICVLLMALTWGRKPDSALRALFRVDTFLYGLEGQVASRYGGGVHPKHRITKYKDFFVDRIRPGQRVLDVGCNTGVLSQDMAERAGAVVTAMDSAPKYIAHASSKSPHPNVTYLLGEAPKDLPTEPFDVVVLSNFLEHIPERPAFLRQVAATTKAPLFLIRVPLLERDWRVPLRRELGVEWRLVRDHETEYTLEDFAQEMDAAGLTVTEMQVRWGEIWASATPATAGNAASGAST